MKNIKVLLFDWGDTLMFDNPEYSGPMVLWPQITMMSGVKETVPKLSRMYKCVVASNASESNSESMKGAFQKVELDSFFSLFITSKELNVKKPEKDFYTKIALILGCSEKNICMIGNDYRKDIEPAKSVGMKTILITKHASHFPCADFVVEDFYQLTNVLSQNG